MLNPGRLSHSSIASLVFFPPFLLLSQAFAQMGGVRRAEEGSGDDIAPAYCKIKSLGGGGAGGGLGGGWGGDRRASFSLSTPPPFLPACESLPLRPEIQTMQSGRSVIPNPARRFRSGAACEKRRRRASSIQERGEEERTASCWREEMREERKEGAAGPESCAQQREREERGEREERQRCSLSLTLSLSLLSATPHPPPIRARQTDRRLGYHLPAATPTGDERNRRVGGRLVPQHQQHQQQQQVRMQSCVTVA